MPLYQFPMDRHFTIMQVSGTNFHFDGTVNPKPTTAMDNGVRYAVTTANGGGLFDFRSRFDLVLKRIVLKLTGTQTSWKVELIEDDVTVELYSGTNETDVVEAPNVYMRRPGQVAVTVVGGNGDEVAMITAVRADPTRVER